MAFPALEMISTIGGLLNKFIPDKDLAAKNQATLALTSLTQEFELAKSQTVVNATEAASSSLFVAGWRPAAGWVCVFTLGLGAVAKVFVPAIIILICAFSSADVTSLKAVSNALGNIDITFFLTILGGMLGLGGMRSYEKIKGVSTEGLRTVRK